jgi:hypothetical protein
MFVAASGERRGLALFALRFALCYGESQERLSLGKTGSYFYPVCVVRIPVRTHFFALDGSGFEQLIEWIRQI